MGGILCCLFYKYFPLCLGVYADAIVDLFHNSSHSIKDPNQTSIIRTNIQVHRGKKNIFVFVPKIRSPIPKSHFKDCCGLVLNYYESRTRQHKILNVKVLCPSKHYFP